MEKIYVAFVHRENFEPEGGRKGKGKIERRKKDGRRKRKTEEIGEKRIKERQGEGKKRGAERIKQAKQT